MIRVICILIGYCFGLFQTAFIYGKLNGIDIREYGSGNAGTTNVMRTLGKKAGIITYLGDCLKAVLCTLTIHLLFGKSHADMEFLLIIYGGLGVILGHNFPFYMGFKGGKGIAATSGFILSLLPYNWLIVLIGATAFFGTMFITRYVSFASLFFVTVVLIEIVVFGQLGYFDMAQSHCYEAYVVTLIIVVMAFVRHKENIKRLLNGTERKIFQKKDNK
ncbi:MAG: glycerol-3-phosphate 1-O-acyltransferase PlsY [Thermoflexaceae bacterium]|nr:glycerol-3-phosphate 1-O-acyltransferase PlsY [Thermoflexaceae bacterium]